MKFNKIIDDLLNIEVDIDDVDNALLLLCALHRSFEHFKEVQAALRIKFKDLED